MNLAPGEAECSAVEAAAASLYHSSLLLSSRVTYKELTVYISLQIILCCESQRFLTQSREGILCPEQDKVLCQPTLSALRRLFFGRE